MTLKCYVVDDEDHASQIIASYIEMTDGLELIGTEMNPVNAFKKISENELSPDITFLDIDMPKISGIELAALIERHTEVIFTTAFPEHAVSAFEGNAVDYMIKPVSYVRFLKAIGKARSKLSLSPSLSLSLGTGIARIADNDNLNENQKEPVKDEQGDSYFFIKINPSKKLVKVAIDEIIYVEAKHNYVEIFLKDVSYLAYLTLSEVEDKLSGGKFIRVQKSYVVNMEMIGSIEGNSVTMMNGSPIVVGKSYRKIFQDFIAEKSLTTKRNLL